MLKRTIKIQLVIFAIFAVVTITTVGVRFVGIGKGLFGSDACTVQADFTDSGGIFTRAEVTYRGVNVGSVGPLTLKGDGVRVALEIEDCKKSKIPASAYAQVTNRS